MTCSWLVHFLLMSCSWLVHDLFTTSLWLLHDFFMTFSWLVHLLFITCSWLLHSSFIFMTSSWFDYGYSTTFKINLGNDFFTNYLELLKVLYFTFFPYTIWLKLLLLDYFTQTISLELHMLMYLITWTTLLFIFTKFWISKVTNSNWLADLSLAQLSPSLFSPIFTHFHLFSPIFTYFHLFSPISPISSNLHLFSLIFTYFWLFSPFLICFHLFYSILSLLSNNQSWFSNDNLHYSKLYNTYFTLQHYLKGSGRHRDDYCWNCIHLLRILSLALCNT